MLVISTESILKRISEFPASGGAIVIEGELDTPLKLVGVKNVDIIGGVVNALNDEGAGKAMSIANVHILLERCENVNIVGLTFNGKGKSVGGIGLVQCKGCWIVNCKFDNVGRVNAVIVAVGGEDNAIVNNKISNTYVPTRGIWGSNWNTVERELRLRVVGNSFYNLGGTAIGGSTFGHLIVGNSISQVRGSGVVIAPGSLGVAQTFATVAYNSMECCEYSGVQADSHDAEILVAGVTLVTNNIRHSRNHGIYAVRMTGWNLVDNFCMDNFKNGVVASNDGKAQGVGIRMSNNFLSNNNSGDLVCTVPVWK